MILEYVIVIILALILGVFLGLFTAAFLFFLEKRAINKHSIPSIMKSDKVFFNEGEKVDLKGQVSQQLGIKRVNNPVLKSEEIKIKEELNQKEGDIKIKVSPKKELRNDPRKNFKSKTPRKRKKD